MSRPTRERIAARLTDLHRWEGEGWSVDGEGGMLLALADDLDAALKLLRRYYASATEDDVDLVDADTKPFLANHQETP